jgi:hypothetical protein
MTALKRGFYKGTSGEKTILLRREGGASLTSSPFNAAVGVFWRNDTGAVRDGV